MRWLGGWSNDVAYWFKNCLFTLGGLWYQDLTSTRYRALRRKRRFDEDTFRIESPRAWKSWMIGGSESSPFHPLRPHIRNTSSPYRPINSTCRHRWNDINDSSKILSRIWFYWSVLVWSFGFYCINTFTSAAGLITSLRRLWLRPAGFSYVAHR